jgi:hypothetical protein
MKLYAGTTGQLEAPPADDEADVDVTFVVTLDDAAAALQATSPLPHPAFLTVALLAIACIGLVVVGNPIAALLIAVAVAALLIKRPRFSFFDRAVMKLLARRVIGSQWRYQLGHDGMAYTSSLASGRSEWAVLKRLRITDEIALLQTTDPGPHAIPIRTLSPKQLQRLRDLVRTFAPHAAVDDGRR